MDQPPERPEFPPGPEEYASGPGAPRPERPAPIVPPAPPTGVGEDERAALSTPRGRDPRAPGGPVAITITWILLIAAVSFVYCLQSGVIALTPPPEEEAIPSSQGLIQLMGRYSVGASRLFKALEPPVSEPSEDDDAAAAEAGDEDLAQNELMAQQLLDQLDAMFPRIANQLRVAMISGETTGGDDAILRIDELLEQVDAGRLGSEAEVGAERETPAWLLQDSSTLRTIYMDGPESIGDEDRKALIMRHGWFARLALTYGLDDDDPVRAEILGKSTRFLALVVTLFFGFGAAGFAGLVALIIVSVFGGGRNLLRAAIALCLSCIPAMLGVALLIFGFGNIASWMLLLALCMVMVGVLIAVSGGLKTRYRAPEAGGSAYLEAFAMFLIWFPAVMVLSAIIYSSTGFDAQPILIWSLLLCAFYPLARGARWAEWKRAMGWHRGAGFFKEALAGVFGYIAGLPIFALAVLTTLVLGAAVAGLPGQEETPPPSHPMFEELGSAGIPGLLLILSLAAVWAPVVEETMFRGALFHHLRGRLRVVAAAIVSSFIFAIIHPQGIIAVPALMGLALVFALMREWRGSIIGPMVAHALHNATLITVLYIGLS